MWSDLSFFFASAEVLTGSACHFSIYPVIDADELARLILVTIEKLQAGRECFKTSN